MREGRFVELLGGAAGCYGGALPIFRGLFQAGLDRFAQALAGLQGDEPVFEFGPVVDSGVGGDQRRSPAGHRLKGDRAEGFQLGGKQEATGTVDQFDELFTGQPAFKVDVFKSCGGGFELGAFGAIAPDVKLDMGEIGSGFDDAIDVFFGGEPTRKADALDAFGWRDGGLLKETALEGGTHYLGGARPERFDIGTEFGIVHEDGGAGFAKDAVDVAKVTIDDYAGEGSPIDAGELLEVGMEGGNEGGAVALGMVKAEESKRAGGNGDHEIGAQGFAALGNSEGVRGYEALGGVARHGNREAQVARLFEWLEHFQRLHVGLKLPEEVVVIGSGAVAFGKGIGEKGDPQAAGWTGSIMCHRVRVSLERENDYLKVCGSRA